MVAPPACSRQRPLPFVTPRPHPPSPAPPLLQGELTARSDIYSFGMLLHELMTCEPPFRGMMAGEVVQQVCVCGGGGGANRCRTWGL